MKCVLGRGTVHSQQSWCLLTLSGLDAAAEVMRPVELLQPVCHLRSASLSAEDCEQYASKSFSFCLRISIQLCVTHCARLWLYRLIQSTHCHFNWICADAAAVASLHTHRQTSSRRHCAAHFLRCWKEGSWFPSKMCSKKRRKKLKSFTLQSITALCVCTFFQSAFSDQSVSCFFMASVFVSFRKHLAGCRRQKPKLVTGYCCWPLVKNRWLLILQFIIIITTTIIIGYAHIARTLPLKLEDMASLNSTLLSDRASQFACKLETHCCCF